MTPRIEMLAAMDRVAQSGWNDATGMEFREAVAELVAAADAMAAFVFLEGIPFDEVDKWPPNLHARLHEFLNRKGDLQLALKRVRGDA